MPSRKSFDQIKASILRPAMTSQFQVYVTFPEEVRSYLQSKNINLTEDVNRQDTLNLSCVDASLPGSSLATLELTSDRTGVTERHVHRRMFDDRIDFTFYVDANKYFPIRFFEKWMRYVTDEDNLADTQRGTSAGIDNTSPSYHYRMRYPDGTNGYRVDGVKIIKFERDHKQSLTYTFVKAYPIAVNSMPVSYDTSNLLKCTVSMSYIRYFIGDTCGEPTETPDITPSTQKPDTKPSSDVPEPIKKSSEVNQNIKTALGPAYFYDATTGEEKYLFSEEQIFEVGKVGDKLSPSLAAEYNAFALSLIHI